MKINGAGASSADKTKGVGGTSTARSVDTKESRRKSIAPDAIMTDQQDKVAISGRAKDVAKAKEIAMAAPDVNEEKIAKLKAAISSGTYNVDADKVAEKMLDDHLFGGV